MASGPLWRFPPPICWLGVLVENIGGQGLGTKPRLTTRRVQLQPTSATLSTHRMDQRAWKKHRPRIFNVSEKSP